MPLLESYNGPQELMPALWSIARQGPDAPDLVVVRDFVTDPDLLERLVVRSAEDDVYNRACLYKVVPALHEADTFIAKQWERVGYKKLAVMSGFILDQVRLSGIGSHVDEDIYLGTAAEAITQGSLCLYGERTFAAERVPVNFKAADGSFDNVAFGKWILRYEKSRPRSKGPLGNSDIQPRTSAVLHAGDLALFPHHPVITLHGVAQDAGKVAAARMITWRATRASV